FALGEDGQLRALPVGHPDALLAWRPGIGWEPLLPSDDPRHPIIDLYLPVCSATALRPITVGHLGQSLDGFIATHAGESQFVPGPSPVRVVFDPGRGLAPEYRVFNDGLAPTLYICAHSLVRAGETHVGLATIVGLDGGEMLGVAELLGLLRGRGCRRIFVEGG